MKEDPGQARVICDTIYRMPESAKALCKIVSLTAAKTSRIFDVSVACVKLTIDEPSTSVQDDLTYCGYKLRCARFTWLNRHSRYFAARLTSLPPE